VPELEYVFRHALTQEADGDWPAAREHFERAAQTAWRTGDLRSWGTARMVLVVAHTISGELERASAWRRS
jgi:hypothetical protein